MASIPCVHCKNDVQLEEVLCHTCAEKELQSLLKQQVKTPDKDFLNSLRKIFFGNNQAKKSAKRQQEAFSLSEIIDKFIIIALKRKYLDGERLVQNENDYQMVEEIIRKKLLSYTISNIDNLIALCNDLWIVNAEIFCVNDICGAHKNDLVVAAAARKMIELIKDRNKIKHAIAKELDEMMFETKQFQK